MKNRAVDEKTSVSAEIKHGSVFCVHIDLQERIFGFDKLDKSCADTAVLKVGIYKKTGDVVLVRDADIADDFSVKSVDKTLAFGEISCFDLVVIPFPEIIFYKRIGARGGSEPQVKYFIGLMLFRSFYIFHNSIS